MTAKKTEAAEPQAQSQGMELTPQQVQVAAQAGVQLFAKEGAVNIPSTWAMNGTFAILNGLLNALAQGVAILANPSVIEELQKKADASDKKVAKKPVKKTPVKK